MIILLSVAAYGLVHSLLASLWVKAQARRLFGPAADRLYRLVYNGIAVITFLPLLALTGCAARPDIVPAAAPLVVDGPGNPIPGFPDAGAWACCKRAQDRSWGCASSPARPRLLLRGW